MQRLRDGDARAFDQLFARHAEAIHRFLTHRVGDAARAEDLTQETFLSLVRARDRFTPGRAFRNWVYAIAVNAARQELRSKLRERSRLRALDTSSGTAGANDGVEQRAVRQALGQLSESQREVLVLHAYEGMTFAEIAQVLGSTGIAVRVRAHRAYRRLRELLRPIEEER